MITVSISEAENRRSALLDKVRHGVTVLITDRSRPVARLERVKPEDAGELEAWLAELERDGIVRRPKVLPSKLMSCTGVEKATMGKAQRDLLSRPLANEGDR